MKQLTGQDENSSKNGADGETDGCLASLSSSASSAEGDRKTAATGKMVGCHLGGRSISCVGQRGNRSYLVVHPLPAMAEMITAKR